MPKIHEVINLIREFAPEQNTAAGYEDNVGLILGRMEGEVRKVVCCLDATTAVIEEAKRLGAELVISHHPFIYGTSLKKINDESMLGQRILLAAENKIAVYSAHTNLDIAESGINDYVADLMELWDYTYLDEINRRELGRIGELHKPLKLSELVQVTKEVFGSVRVVSRQDLTVNKLAIINGGGGGNVDYILKAKEKGAECMITADVKYHVALMAAELGMAIIEPTHYAMEKIYIAYFAEILRQSANEIGLDVEFIESSVEKSPYIFD